MLERLDDLVPLRGVGASRRKSNTDSVDVTPTRYLLPRATYRTAPAGGPSWRSKPMGNTL